MIMDEKTKCYGYKMSDKELDLIYMFKTIFHMDMFEYYPYKHQFMEHTLHDRVKFTELNKIFHIIIEFFEDRILPYGISDKCPKHYSPFMEGVNINTLSDWFFDMITLVVLLYLTTKKNNTILLLTKDIWHDKLPYGDEVKNITIDAKRIPEEMATVFRTTLHYK